MKRGWLVGPPTPEHLERLYYELAQMGASAVGRKKRWPYKPTDKESLIVLAAEMLRYDARLLSILLQFILAHWHDVNPGILRRYMASMRWPQALLVVLEFARSETNDVEVRHFIDYLSAGWPRVIPSERFFLDLERPGSRIAARRRGRSLKAFSRWGFVGTERPTIDAVTKRVVGKYDARTRHSILEGLLENREEIAISDYLDALDHSISRQQAGLDLASCPKLERVGRGRGARWRVRRHST